MTFSTWSCNFTCPWCQNWQLSKSSPDLEAANFISPEEMVARALREGCEGLSVSFTEPLLLFEYTLDAFPLAQAKGLYNNYVSNGYMTLDALRMLRAAGMDAMKFDVKGCEEPVTRHCGADVNVVWRNAREAKRLGMHVEIVTLLIPGVNDGDECLEELIGRHLDSVGVETPLHFTAYYPAYRFTNPPTRVEDLERAHAKAVREGVRYAYVGNVPGHRLENTYCPRCGELVIRRHGLDSVEVRLGPGKSCMKCGEAIPIVGEAKSTRRRFAS